MPASLTGLQQQAVEDLRPATPLERIFANEVAYATWELERVRELAANNPDAEATLNATYTRAARNWTRARRELQRLQTARTGLFLHVHEGIRGHVSLFPLADFARVPAPKPVNPTIEFLAPRRCNEEEEN